MYMYNRNYHYGFEKKDFLEFFRDNTEEADFGENCHQSRARVYSAVQDLYIHIFWTSN